MSRNSAGTVTEVKCDHCGENCDDHSLVSDQHNFCCSGCQMVFGLLHESGMGDYYVFESNPGINQKKSSAKAFEFLDEKEIVDKLLVFSEGGISKIEFHLPQIHCSSCLWLLENISRLDSGVTKSIVNFSSKKATITFKDEVTSVRNIVELLTKIGYEPSLNLFNLEEDKKSSLIDRRLIYKLGLAGFSFGNIMLLSFPEYLGFDKASYLFHIGYINILLAIPVLLYSGVDYLISAYKGLRMRNFNIDLPIALGMLALFGRSIYEILGQHGEGYLDSFTGFIFFLLIGRWFQAYTYKALDFDRNYKSYFPISASVKSGNQWTTKSLDQLQPGDLIRIRNQELIPADGLLKKGKARVDYSFVTGEADLITKSVGDSLFAGGRHQGESIDVILTKRVDQSYLTQLWNEDTFKETGISSSSNLISHISKYFTAVVIFLALLTMSVWFWIDSSQAFNTFTSVLIVACPCALALAIPFTYGNILRILSAKGFFLRNVETIEHVQDIDYVIFDKTGTITDSQNIEISFNGKPLNELQRSLVKSACSHSAHPLSKAIVGQLKNDEIIEVDSFEDIIGSGLVAQCGNHRIRVGSSAFIFGSDRQEKENGVFLEINDEYVGCFKFKHAFRENIEGILAGLRSNFKLEVLSGDTDHEASRIERLLGEDGLMHFNQSPKNKLERIQYLQAQGHKVMMIGDGLNDAGALKQANVGLVISDAVNNFSPACDGIVDARQFSHLYNYLAYLRKAKYIIYGAFFLAFMYNTIGLYFAVTGQLSPVIAAILMPLSSITVIVYGVVASWMIGRKD